MRRTEIDVWLLLWTVGCFGEGRGDVPTFTVARGDFDVTLAIPGELKAVRSVSLSAPDMNGQVKVTWIIDEGARVQAGDVLVRFDETELQERLEQAQTDLDVALTKIDQQRAQQAVRLLDLENEVTAATLGLERAKMRVTESETIPRVDRESAKLDVQESEIAVQRSRSSLESARLEGLAEIELLRLDADRARRELAQAERIRGLATVTAPAAGIVVLPSTWKGGTNGPVTAGDTLWGGSALVELPDLSEMEVRAWVHEVDAALVHVDQPAQIIIDAHPDTPIAGTVTKVADLAVKRDRNATVKHLQVTLALEATTAEMKPGMTVRAEVLAGHEAGVLAVPQEAVFHEGAESWVLVSGLTGFRRTPVVLGRTNDTHVVVTEGLSEGDVVALVDPERDPAAPTSPGSPALPSAANAAPGPGK